MRVISLLEKVCPEKIPNNIGDYLGDGADGETRAIAGTSNKAIKLSVIYQDVSLNLNEKYKEIYDLISFIQKNNPEPYCKVYEHDLLCMESRDTINGKQDFLIHYCIMEKLNKISEDEKKVFHTVLSKNVEDSSYSQKELVGILKNLSMALDFSEKNIIMFYEQLKQSPIIHNDITVDIRGVRNIMKDASGKFKLIDFDRATRR